MGSSWVVLLFPSLCFLIFLPPSQALDTLLQGQAIKDGQTLLSPSKTFELGFFSPGNSRNRYVAIWYHGISPLATIWIANRDDPLPDTSGTFGLSAQDGNLVLLDGNLKLYWSSNFSSPSSSAVNASVRLSDEGNLIVSNSDVPRRWQSFDYPTDSFLPGMKILMDYETGQSQLFNSWKSPDDPGTGKFSIGLDPGGSPQIYMWEDSILRWRSGQWNGQTFIGTRMRPLFLYGFKLTTDDVGKKRYFTFSTFNTSLYRFVVQPDGVENATILVAESKLWSPIWSEPTVKCELYNYCGNNAVCVDAGTEGRCACLLGYEGKGCERKTRWRCERNGSGEADVFQRLEGLKLPDLADWASTTGDAPSCRKLCEGNCTCRAYAFVDGIGCLLWGRDLVDVHQSHGPNTGDLYFKIAASDVENGSKRKTWVIAVAVSLVGILIIVLFMFLLWWKCKSEVQVFLKKGKVQKKPSASLTELAIDSFGLSCASDVSGKSSELPIYPFDAIASATQSFSASNKLGQGGFGDVYKGVLPWGQEVAVKRLSRSSGQGLEEFKNEAILIAKLQHRNLVRLMGCCIEKEEKMLVYEYMPNKSLDALIFDDTKRELLDWNRRFSIIEGIARGLLYLHRDSRLRIVHRDLKASNILLDEEMNPKISDFGMARIFGADQNQENTTRVVGTFGYMSPEYAMEGLFSVKSDVYSFGVLMLEIISGQKNSSFSKSEHATNLVGYAWRLWNENSAMDLADKAMGNSVSTHEVLRCIHVGLLCVQDKAADRPLMSSVVMMLGSNTAILTTPCKPTFTLEGGPGDADSPLPFEDIFTSSDVTMTRVNVR